MDQIISFDKSFQSRLQEYEDLFSSVETLSFSKIQSEWSYYLEFTIDPSGWQAVWKIPRAKCEELKIPFPTVVLVFALDVHFRTLSALVRILGVQDDEIQLPEKHHVPLTQLWPTKQQDKSVALNIEGTANSLDMLRFFYLHLLMPWDEDEDANDWKGSHLYSRLRLWYDLRNGTICKPTAEHIFSLLNEAKRIHVKKQQMTIVCNEIDSDIEEENLKGSDRGKIVESLIEINVRLIEIQNEVTLLENEMFRKVILKRQKLMEEDEHTEKEESHIWIISKDNTAGNLIKLLTSVEILYPNERLSFASNLSLKLESASFNDTLLLSPGVHSIKQDGALINNFSIRGVSDVDKVRIEASGDDVMFDCVGEEPTFEYITFDCKNSQCGILIRKGHVTLKNCKLIGDSHSTTQQGILVLKGAKLSLCGCEITGFSTSIVGNTGSSIDMKDSVIQDGRSGFKIYDHCEVGIYESTIKNCKEYGILLYTDQDVPLEKMDGSFRSLELVSNIIFNTLDGSNNEKGDTIVKKTKLSAKENLFDNPNTDPTIWLESDEEMETSEDNPNITVLDMGNVDDEEL